MAEEYDSDGMPVEGSEAPLPAGGSGMVMGLKIFAIISGVLALLMVYLMTVGRIASEDTEVMGLDGETLVTLGLVMGVVGLVFGAISVFIGPRRISKSRSVPPLNSLMLGIGILSMLIAGMLAVFDDHRYAEVTNLTIEGVIYILLYAWFILWFLELASTSMRYAVVDDYIRKHGIGGFSLAPVLGTYFVWFFLLMTVIFMWSAAVVVLTPSFLVEVTRSYGYEQLADSVMFNSVYSVAISMAVWFTIIGLIVTVVYSFVKDTKTEVIKTETEDEF